MFALAPGLERNLRARPLFGFDLVHQVKSQVQFNIETFLNLFSINELTTKCSLTTIVLTKNGKNVSYFAWK